nr:MAG TPA: hypothetical protein [Caudoviricetes sp.]
MGGWQGSGEGRLAPVEAQRSQRPSVFVAGFDSGASVVVR